uniref:(California timema) hypothetical protein n=1 Tax=Timema californicum TaxID=61474 RepID=A0A7R9J7B8_TIMCA|nr:unnamed protein product [Timema californicum]
MAFVQNRGYLISCFTYHLVWGLKNTYNKKPDMFVAALCLLHTIVISCTKLDYNFMKKSLNDVQEAITTVPSWEPSGGKLTTCNKDFRQVSENIVLAMKKRVYSNVSSQSGSLPSGTTTNALEDLERLSVLTSSPSTRVGKDRKKVGESVLAMLVAVEQRDVLAT